MDFTNLIQQFTAAITGFVPAPFWDFITQITQFFTGILQGFGL